MSCADGGGGAGALSAKQQSSLSQSILYYIARESNTYTLFCLFASGTINERAAPLRPRVVVADKKPFHNIFRGIA